MGRGEQDVGIQLRQAAVVLLMRALMPGGFTPSGQISESCGNGNIMMIIMNW
jgi:hypothetical protein